MILAVDVNLNHEDSLGVQPALLSALRCTLLLVRSTAVFLISFLSARRMCGVRSEQVAEIDAEQAAKGWPEKREFWAINCVVAPSAKLTWKPKIMFER